MSGWKVVNTHVVQMYVRMMDNRRSQIDRKVLLTMTVDLRKKRVHGAVGYDLLSDIHSENTVVSIHSEITSRLSEENWNIVVCLNH